MSFVFVHRTCKFLLITVGYRPTSVKIMQHIKRRVQSFNLIHVYNFLSLYRSIGNRYLKLEQNCCSALLFEIKKIASQIQQTELSFDGNINPRYDLFYRIKSNCKSKYSVIWFIRNLILTMICSIRHSQYCIDV